MRPDQLERRLQERLDALGPMAPHALLKVLLMPDAERAAMIGKLASNPPSRSAAELLIDCEEDRTLRTVLVGMLREAISNSGDAARSVPMLQPGLDRRTIRS